MSEMFRERKLERDPRLIHAKSWIDAIRRDGLNLTSWEKAFVSSVGVQLTRNDYLSKEQLDTLEGIYAEKT